MRRCAGLSGLVCLAIAFAVVGGATARPLVTRSRIVAFSSFPALVPAATLPARPTDGYFAGGGGSGETIVSEFVQPNKPVGPGMVPSMTLDVYGRSPTGWASATVPAHLTAVAGAQVGGIAAADDAVLVGDASSAAAGIASAYLYARPPGGWSGAIQATGRLAAPIVGPTNNSVGPLLAVSAGTAFISGGAAVYAFDRPALGWSGVPGPSATLQIPSGLPVASMAASGRTLVAEQRDVLYVFVEPAGGWSGTIEPTARLRIPGLLTDNPRSLAVSAKAIIVQRLSDEVYGRLGGVVFSEPAGGWSARAQTATLQFVNSNADVSGAQLAFVGSTAIAMGAVPGPEHTCPCTDLIYSVNPATWAASKTTTLTRATTLNNTPGSIGTAGTAVVVSGVGGLHIYRPVNPATVTTTGLTRLDSSTPTLAITATADRGSDTIQQLTIRLPKGLALNPRHARQIKLTGAGHTTRTVTPTKLAVTIAHPRANAKVSIVLARGALAISTRTARRLRQLANSPAPHRHQPATSPLSLAIPVQVFGAHHSVETTRITFTIT